MDIFILADDEIDYLQRVLTLAQQKGDKVRVSVEGGLKIARGAGMWTPPMGAKADASGHYPA